MAADLLQHQVGNSSKVMIEAKCLQMLHTWATNHGRVANDTFFHVTLHSGLQFDHVFQSVHGELSSPVDDAKAFLVEMLQLAPSVKIYQELELDDAMVDLDILR